MTWANAAGVRKPSRCLRQKAGSLAPPVRHKAVERATCSAASVRSWPCTCGMSDTAVVAKRSHHSARPFMPVRKPSSAARSGPVAATERACAYSSNCRPTVRINSSARGSRTVSSRPGKIGNSPWKPRMFHGSISAPQSMPRRNRSSASARALAASAGRPFSAANCASVCRNRTSVPNRVAGAGILAARCRAASG